MWQRIIQLRIKAMNSASSQVQAFDRGKPALNLERDQMRSLLPSDATEFGNVLRHVMGSQAIGIKTEPALRVKSILTIFGCKLQSMRPVRLIMTSAVPPSCQTCL
jgi:hypothetical protein